MLLQLSWTEMMREEIETMWNEPQGKLEIEHQFCTIVFALLLLTSHS